MSIFKKLNVEDKLKKTESSKGSDFNSDVKFFELKIGKNRIRILPPTAKYPDYEFKTYRHYGIGEDGKQSVLCPKRTFPEMKFKCPICEMSSELFGNKDKESARKLFAAERNFANVINLDEEETPKNVYVMGYGYRMSNTFIKKIADIDYGDITDLETGQNITIEKELNKGSQPEYTIDCKKQCACPEFDESQVTQLNKLYTTVLTYNALKAVLQGDSVDSAVKEYGVIDVETGEQKKGSPENPDESVISEKPKAKKIETEEDEPVKPKKAIIVEDDTDEIPTKPKTKKIEEDEESDEIIQKQYKKPVVEDEDDEHVKPKTKEPFEDDEPVTKKSAADDDDDDDIMAQLRARKAAKK